MEHLLLKINRHYSFLVRYLHCKYLGPESFNVGRGGPLQALKAYSE